MKILILLSSQLDVLDLRRTQGQNNNREVVDGWVGQKLSGCAHCSGCPQPHCRCGCQETLLDQRLQEGELMRIMNCRGSSRHQSLWIKLQCSCIYWGIKFFYSIEICFWWLNVMFWHYSYFHVLFKVSFIVKTCNQSHNPETFLITSTRKIHHICY